MEGYGANELRKITGIGHINRTGPDSGGSGGMYKHDQKRRQRDDFASILDVEKNAHDTGEISVKSTGYGPKGLPSTVMIRMKDYTFQ